MGIGFLNEYQGFLQEQMRMNNSTICICDLTTLKESLNIQGKERQAHDDIVCLE